MPQYASHLHCTFLHALSNVLCCLHYPSATFLAQSSNPYIVKLSILDDDIATNVPDLPEDFYLIAIELFGLLVIPQTILVLIKFTVITFSPLEHLPQFFARYMSVTMRLQLGSAQIVL